MITTIRKSIIAWVCLVVYLSGCATSPRAATPSTENAQQTRVAVPPSNNIRKSLGTIGVVSASSGPAVRFLAPTPVKGAGAAAGRKTGHALAGFWRGCGQTIEVTAETVIIPIVTLYGCVVLTPFVAVGGALHGHSDSDASKTNRAAKAKHKAEIKKLRPVVDSALNIVSTQPPLQVLVLEQAQARTHHAFVNVIVRDTVTSRERESYRTLAIKGVDTILEATMWRLDVTPDYAFEFTAKVRLIRVTDNVELYAGTYVVRTEARTISEWTADEGDQLAAALINAYQLLAQRIVDSLFLRHPLPHGVRPQDRLYLM